MVDCDVDINYIFMPQIMSLTANGAWEPLMVDELPGPNFDSVNENLGKLIVPTVDFPEL